MQATALKHDLVAGSNVFHQFSNRTAPAALIFDKGGDEFWIVAATGRAKRTEMNFWFLALRLRTTRESWSEEQCPAIRHRLGMRQHAEFHAREMSEPEILFYLQTARDAGVIMGAVVLKKPLPTDAEALANFTCAVAAQNFFRVFLLALSRQTLLV